ncbi:alpha/beta-hydrolase [Hymenopellis radicata]|nr:alpha/beta-hydrolase [Hymenopellis radicata]
MVDALVMATLLYLAALAGFALGAPQVQVGNTTLIGRDVTLLQQDFFGVSIPFAEPPLGELRLKPPVTKFFLNEDVFDASSFGPGCLQPVRLLARAFSHEEPSQCHVTGRVVPHLGRLSHDQYIPSLRNFCERVAASVILGIWWGLPFGRILDVQWQRYCRAERTQENAHHVRELQLQTWPLGFPQGNEADFRGELNLALKDYLAALTWVQMNIHAFGGDKTKVTIFGESAGSIMTAVLLLQPSIARLARGAILESGSAASSLTFRARARQDSWEDFVTGIPSCEQLATTTVTFDCIRRANTAEVFEGLLNSLAVADEEIPFGPTLDGPLGLFPDFPSRLFSQGMFARLPFIAGTNLDEGTSFVPPTINLTEEEEKAFVVANFSPPGLPDKVVDRLFELYPDDPALGSPYNTGNETFGLAKSFKRMASLTGDLSFQSQRRLLSQTAAKAGVKTYVAHGNDVFFVYGLVALLNETASSIALSRVMIDYWVSFATSLDPNDGLGVPRPLWPQYTPDNQVVMQLNGDNLTAIPDDYRKEQIDFINDNAVLFHH